MRWDPLEWMAVALYCICVVTCCVDLDRMENCQITLQHPRKYFCTTTTDVGSYCPTASFHVSSVLFVVMQWCMIVITMSFALDHKNIQNWKAPAFKESSTEKSKRSTFPYCLSIMCAALTIAVTVYWSACLSTSVGVRFVWQTWRKFGQAAYDLSTGPDPATTQVADDVFLTLVTNKEVGTPSRS